MNPESHTPATTQTISASPSAKPRTLRVAYVNDTDGRVNIGCRLTSQTLKNHLAQEYGKRGIRLQMLSTPYLFGRKKLMVKYVWAAYKTMKVTPTTFQHWLRMLAWAEYGEDQCEAALSADVVFFQPEGTLGTNSSLGNILGFLSLPLLAQMHGKKVMCFNGTIPKFDDAAREEVIRHFLAGCAYATARDAVTAEHYHCDYLPDAAFLYDAQYDAKQKRKSLLITTGARNSEAKDQLLITTALAFCRKHDLIPLVLSKSSKRFLFKKEEVLAMGGQFLEEETLERAATLVSNCVLHIGGRYHMAILSLTVGVPSVLWSINTHKNEWLARDFNTIEIASSEEEILANAEKLLAAARQRKWALSPDLVKARTIFHNGLAKFADRHLSLGWDRLMQIVNDKVAASAPVVSTDTEKDGGDSPSTE